jgi:Mlc titration factor MtfA (ptsG expression regulator)
MFGFFRDRRRRKLLAEPFPPHWEVLLRRNVGHYPRLSDAERAKVRDIARVLVAEKSWEGVGGLVATEEIRLTVAAQAALLLLGREHDYYARVAAVVVYPGAFRTPVEEDGWEDDGLSEDPLSGQAVYRGPVILSWDEALAEGRDPDGGHNVVVHEFAHQLDFLDGATDGTPALDDPDLLARWGPVMQAAFDAHRQALDAGADTFFTEHAGENEAEFFADASEAFFCRPHDLEAEARGVFGLLQGFYKLDPRRWFPDHPKLGEPGA